MSYLVFKNLNMGNFGKLGGAGLALIGALSGCAPGLEAGRTANAPGTEPEAGRTCKTTEPIAVGAGRYFQKCVPGTGEAAETDAITKAMAAAKMACYKDAGVIFVGPGMVVWDGNKERLKPCDAMDPNAVALYINHTTGVTCATAENPLGADFVPTERGDDCE